MNPISLKLVNFRSYKNETILFPHKGVMPIVGKNGHGKSSVFYGLLLALYGKVVIGDTETPVKELIIDDGSKEMYVIYKFSHEKFIYEVERVYRLSKSRAGVVKCEQAKCELRQITRGGSISLTAKSKSKTSEKIIDILGKDCSNFCNSSLFPQDEANRLARLKPAEFIEEISKLKNITIWGSLREKAVSKLDKVKVMVGGAADYIANCKLEIERKPSVEAAISELNKKIVSIKESINKIEKELSVITESKLALSVQADNIAKIEKDIVIIRSEIQEFNDDIISIDRKINEEGEIVNRKVEIESDFAEFQLLDQNKIVMDQALMNRNSLMEQLTSLNNEVENARKGAESAYQATVATYDNAVLALQNVIPVQQRHEECQQIMGTFLQLENNANDIEATNQQMSQEITALNVNNEHLSVSIAEETEKMNGLLSNGICFECERPVDEGGMEFIKVKKIEKIDSFKLQGRNNVDRISLLEQQIGTNNVQLSSFNEQLKQKSAIDREIGQLESQILNMNTAQETVNNTGPEMERLKGILDSRSYSDKAEIIFSVQQQLGNIVYNPDEHMTVNSRYDILKNSGILKQQLERAESELPDLIVRRESVNGKIENKNQALTVLSESLNAFDRDNIMSKLNVVKSQEEEAQQTLSDKQDEFSNFMKEFGAQQQIMEEILAKEQELEEKMEEVADLKDEQFLLDRAIEMYSKSGIPTLIIENMLPEIENKANELLRVMQADRSVSFERPKRADGSYQEKIVIMIRDRRGKKRSFNTYSGAECFQISFAIRIAICGGEDVVFIDEGFGKLDPDNLQLIMRTLSALQSQFDKIILVTHVKDLVDMFDVKLQVKLNKEGYSIAEWTKAA